MFHVHLIQKCQQAEVLLFNTHKEKNGYLLSGCHAAGGLWNCGDDSYQCCWLSNKVEPFFLKSSLKHCCCFFFLILTCLLVDLAFLFYRIAFKAFIQRYGLIAKQSTSESRTHCAGKCCLVLRANLDKSDLFFFGLMVSSFLSIAHFINSTHNSLLLLGHFHLVYKNKTF